MILTGWSKRGSVEGGAGGNRRCDAVDRVMDVAETLFAASGYEAVSVGVIAEGSGVSKGNIFHHFESKDKLYFSVLKRACAKGAGTLREAASGASDAGGKISLFAHAHLRYLLDHPQRTKLLLRELVEGFFHLGAEFPKRELAESFMLLMEIIGEGQRKEEIRDDVDASVASVALMAANIFVAAFGGFMQEIAAKEPGFFEKRFVPQLLKIFFEGARKG